MRLAYDLDTGRLKPTQEPFPEGRGGAQRSSGGFPSADQSGEY